MQTSLLAHLMWAANSCLQLPGLLDLTVGSPVAATTYISGPLGPTNMLVAATGPGSTTYLLAA